MKLAIIATTFAVRGGAENMILKLADELLRRGHQVTIFTSEHQPDDPDIPEMVRPCFVDIAAGGHYSTWIDWLWAGLKLRRRLQEFDLVNPHNFPANVWVYYAKLFSRAFPPIIWYCHEPSRQLYDQSPPEQVGRYTSLTTHVCEKFQQHGLDALWRLLQKSVFYGIQALCGRRLRAFHTRLDQRAVHSCDRILANSRYTASKIQAIYGIPATVCYQGITPVPRGPLPDRANKSYFLTVARLERLKHVDTVIQALDMLIHRHHQCNIMLRVVGTGTQEAALHALVQELQLHDAVVFPGYVADADMHRLYADALAVVYVPVDEPFGLVPLEAMMHATPVIVSNSGGTVETVKNHETGLHVEPGNIEQLAEAMLWLAQHREQAAQMGKCGYAHVMRQWTVKHFVDRFEQMIGFREDVAA
ncbi:MAG: glycosyltransferase family 4 protein [Lentisphaerae bacterium]|nr:glycosyltransferase family 4 protein [Lentisphaerota bacterium]